MKNLKSTQCPVCQSENLFKNTINPEEPDTAWQSVVCKECQASWINIFKLVESADLILPKNVSKC